MKGSSLDLKKHYIRFNKGAGPDGMIITGLPGKGKSQLATRSVRYAMEMRDENVVMPGDMFCEWLNIAYYAYETILIVPKGQKILEVNIPEHIPFKKIELDYDNLDIMKFIKKSDKRKLIVVYDAHFTRSAFYKRVELWVKIFRDLIYRSILLDDAITLLFHEAGIYFPQYCSGEHWYAMRDFAYLYPEARKGFVRCIFISQNENEITFMFRKKCLWRIFRKGSVSKDNPQPVYRKTPFLSIDQFILSVGGGLYSLDNVVPYLEEHNKGSRMKPLNPIEFVDKGEKVDEKTTVRDTKEKIILNLIDQGMNYRQIKQIVDVSIGTISHVHNNLREKHNGGKINEEPNIVLVKT